MHVKGSGAAARAGPLDGTPRLRWGLGYDKLGQGGRGVPVPILSETVMPGT